MYACVYIIIPVYKCTLCKLWVNLYLVMTYRINELAIVIISTEKKSY